MRHFFVPALAILWLAAWADPTPAATAGLAPVAVDVPSANVPALQLLWKASGFHQPEGVALAPDGGYFISSIGPGLDTARDGNGYISKLNPDGTVANARFAVGLDAPLGLVVHQGVLYAADRDGVAMFDATTGAATGKLLIEGVDFLNDMTVWKGEVLVSDSGTATIHRVTPDGASVFASSRDWDGINGILGDGERLLITTMAEGKLIELRGVESQTLIATGMKDADGVGLVPGGGYLVSSWPGEIHHVGADGTVTRLMDTRADSIEQNDLSVFGDVVIVPNWKPGTVTAWKIVAP